MQIVDSYLNETPQTIDLTNARELDNKYSVEATLRCSGGADGCLRSVAKYDFKWDDVGFLEIKFD
jgi:hypothetical protein